MFYDNLMLQERGNIMQECEDLIKIEHQIYLDTLNNRIKNESEVRASRLYYMYRLLVSREALLIKKIAGNDNSVETYFAIYYYLLWNGILSKNNLFTFGSDKEELKFSLMRISVPLGKGVCRNIVLNFEDILKELRPEIKFRSIGTHVTNSEDIIPPTNFITIRKNVSSTPNDVRHANDDKFPNHLETLIMSNEGEKKEFFLYDPTNFRITHLKFCANLSDKKFYDARTSVLFDKIDIKESPQCSLEHLEEIIRLLYRATAVPLPQTHLIKIRKYGIDRCLASDKDIKLFRNANSDLFEEISRERTKILTKN